MEKFYMQDLQEEKSQKKKKGFQRQVELPVALSVLVVAFALFSVASFGLINRQVDTVSYAAPAEGFDILMTLPRADAPIDTGVRGWYDGSTQADGEFYVPYYYAGSASDANRLFCVEHKKDVTSGAHYTPFQGVYYDSGVDYILRNSIASGKKILGDSAPDFVEVWATQVAIWVYLNKEFPDDPVHAIDATGANSLAELPKINKFQVIGPNSETKQANVSGVYDAINNLVNKASDISQQGKVAYNMNIVHTGEMKKTPDGKYFQTPLVSVVGIPSDSLISYDIVNLKGVDGIKIVDESGKDLAPKNIPAAKKFYLRVPADKIADKTVSITYDINGTYTDKTLGYYVSDGHQGVVDLTDGYAPYSKGDGFNIVGSPDTGMNAAQTIYFIGLIVLLCGVGIVYANTKPVESKQ